jgi:hypothetical protein
MGADPKPVWCVLIAGYCGCAVAAGSFRRGVSLLIRLTGCPSAISVRISLRYASGFTPSSFAVCTSV